MTDEQAIVACALDYYEGWFDGDAARMERALHPELAKRALEIDTSGGETLETITAREMIEATANGGGKRLDPGEREIDVRVDDVFDGIATVTVHSAIYVDYLQLVRTREGWKIANAVWQWTDKGRRRRDAARQRAL